MANNFGNLNTFTVMSQQIVDELTVNLAPISAFSNDLSDEVASGGDSVTMHMYGVGTTPTVQNVSGGGTISYTTQTSDVTLTPVNVKLAHYQPDGFTIPEHVFNKSAVKDLMSKFAGRKVYELSKAILTKVNTIIDGQYTNYYDASSFTWAKFMAAASAGYDLGMNPAQTTMVLKGSTYAELVANVPTLSGVNADEALETGIIEKLAGIKVIRTNCLPAAAPKGYLTTKDALGFAARPLAKLDSGLSYGQSDIFKASNETGLSIRSRKYQDPDNGQIKVVFDLLYGMEQANRAALIRFI